MSLPARPPLRATPLPGQEAMTSLDAYKAARLYITQMHLASAAYEASPVGSAQWNAMETFDTAANALLGLMGMLEARGVLAEVEQYLDATYGRV